MTASRDNISSKSFRNKTKLEFELGGFDFLTRIGGENFGINLEISFGQSKNLSKEKRKTRSPWLGKLNMSQREATKNYIGTSER